MVKKLKLLVVSLKTSSNRADTYFTNSATTPFYSELENQFAVKYVYDERAFNQAHSDSEPDLVLIDPGVSSESCLLPSPSLLSEISTPVALYCSYDAHYFNHTSIIEFIKKSRIEAIFAHDIYQDFYPEEFKEKHVFIPNSYNHKVFKPAKQQKEFTCGFYGAGFFDQQQYPWRKKIAARVLPEFPSMVLPRPSGLREHGLVGDSFASIIRKTKFCFGCTSIKDIPVKKIFEIPACGSMLMVNQSLILKKLGFEDGINCCVVDSSNVLQRIRYYLNNPLDYENVVNAGINLVSQHHQQSNRQHIKNWLETYRNTPEGYSVVQTNITGSFSFVKPSTKSKYSFHFPDNEVTRNLKIARTALANKDYEVAAAHYGRVNKIYPIFEEAILGLVQSLLLLNDHIKVEKVISLYFRMMSKRPKISFSKQLLLYRDMVEFKNDSE